MFRKLLLALAATAGMLASATAADDPQLARIAGMPLAELDAFIATITASVGQDTLKLRSTAKVGDCLELRRAANSFALGYGYLGEARDVLARRSEREAQVMRFRAIQARVITFAARVRAEDWLTQRCRSYAVPAEHATDPRYQTPAKVADTEYTEAVIEARQAAETNLAIAVAAGMAAKCPGAISAAQNIALLVPYLDKLLADTARRPQVLGPRASRRALEVSRRQLLAARDKLQAELGASCRAPAAAPPAEQG